MILLRHLIGPPGSRPRLYDGPETVPSHGVHAGLKSSVDGLVSQVWDPMIMAEITHQATPCTIQTQYPRTWTSKADVGASAMASLSVSDDDEGGDMPSFLMVDLMKPSAAGSPDPASLAFNERVRAEVAFVADAWGRTMDKSEIVQITRIQNAFQYKRFSRLKEVRKLSTD